MGRGSLGKAVVFEAHPSSWWASTVGGDPLALQNGYSALSEERKVDETTRSCMLQPDFEVSYAFAFLICETLLCSPGYCLRSCLVVAEFRLGFGSDDASMTFTYKGVCLVAVFQVSERSAVAVSPASVLRE